MPPKKRNAYLKAVRGKGGESYKRRCRSQGVAKKRKQRYRKRWINLRDTLGSLIPTIKNSVGKVRTFEENKMIILAIHASLKRHLKAHEQDDNSPISWRIIGQEVSRDFHYKSQYVTKIRQMFLDTGDVMISESNPRGQGLEGAKESRNRKVSEIMLRSIALLVDTMHSEGKGVVARHITAHLLDDFEILIHRRTTDRLVHQLGLTWAPMTAAKRTFASYRKVVMRNYLVKLDFYVKRQSNGDDSRVFVFTDEFYVNTNHGVKCSYVSSDKNNPSETKIKTGKGRQLVIMHAITLEGPLCETELDGVTPVDDLKWTGDTCHPEKRIDGKLTAETLWVAQSHAGDYHDNMNSVIFMQWLKNKLCPLFARKYPGKKMVLITDNAPYHHAREIGSLSGYSKKGLLDLMMKHDVPHLDLPLVSEERFNLLSTCDDAEDDITEDRGSTICIPFIYTEQKNRSSKGKPRIASLDELRLSFVTWMKEFQPRLLACKVELYLKELGHEILWTPPYASKLQPIKLFWAAGKNHVALQHKYDSTMPDVVRALREGWHGNRSKYAANHPLVTRAVDCRGLWRTCLEYARTIYIPICEGISGEIGSLVLDEAHTDEMCDIPIDTLMLDLTVDQSEVDDIGALLDV